MRTYDKLIATIFAGRSQDGLRLAVAGRVSAGWVDPDLRRQAAT